MEKSAETRHLLVETALRLFRTQGYQATTMRRIATEAGVSPGNAYYYFSGKDELVHELYLAIQRDHRDATMPRLVAGSPLADNFRTALHAGLDVMEPYHAFGTTFLHNALPTNAGVSPFSAESEDARSMAIGLMDQVVRASSVRASQRLTQQLPRLLWLVYLGITLHWVTDASEDRHRTRVLVDGAAPLVARTVSLSRVPGARTLVDEALDLLVRMTHTSGQEKERSTP